MHRRSNKVSKKGIIVNLSKNAHAVKHIVDELTRNAHQWSFLDFTGSSFDFESIEYFSARIFDENNQIEKGSLREYVNQVGTFSFQKCGGGRTVRWHQINRLPIYWVTNFAEKHPFNHWLFALFFFRDFIKAKPAFFHEYGDVVIIIPVPVNIFKAYIEKESLLLNQKIVILSDYTFIKPVSRKIVKNVIRFYIKYLFYYVFKCFRYRKFRENEQPNLMLINLSTSFSPTFLQKHIRTLLQANGRLLNIRLSTFLFNPIGTESGFLIRSYPKPSKVLNMVVQILQQARMIARNYKKAITNNDFWGVIVNAELFVSLQDISLFFSHLWLTKFFQSMEKPLKVFYEDEMYKTGRIISSAAMLSNNANITTIAYQHGNISQSHTVYRFCDAEIAESELGKKDAVPFPDIFLVWGEYFKKQFLEWFSFNPERVMVAGNLAYFELQKKYFPKEKSRDSKKVVLWCTTSLDFAKGEYEIVRQELEKKDFSIIVRMHPNFIIKNELREFIPAHIYSAIRWDNTPFIYDALYDSDLVICSGHSTVFIDCIILKKPVIRLFNPYIMKDFLTGSHLFVKSVATAREFSVALSLAESESSFNSNSGFLFLESDEIWRKVILI